MTSQAFDLIPFPHSELASRWAPMQITGTIARQAQQLCLHYMLQGPLSEVVIPGRSSAPARRNQLWQTTCFEFFLARPQSDVYWEFNLSPSGDWNIYRFAAYRQGMEPEGALPTLALRVEIGNDYLSLALDVDLTPLALPDYPWAIALSTVIQLKTGPLSYWALTHPHSEPDFHRREGFWITV